MKKGCLVLFLLICVIPKLFSCTCGMRNSVTEEFKERTLIVAGQIINKQVFFVIDSVELKKYLADGGSLEKNLHKRFFGKHYTKFQFVISESFKGQFNKDTINIYTEGNSCSYNFEIGKQYIVYGENRESKTNSTNIKSFPHKFYPKGDNLIWTHYCYRTKQFSKKESNALRRNSKKLITKDKKT